MLIEIKSSEMATEDHIRSLRALSADWDSTCEAQIWSQDELHKKMDHIEYKHWQKGLAEM